jgi:tetratricopeptide (TPR) repeat protein
LDEAEKLIKPLIQDKNTRTPAVLTAYSDLLYTQGRFSDALSYVEEADLRHPNCENTLYVKARILQALNRFSEATAVAERVVQIDTNSRLARLLLLKMYVQQGRTRDADSQKAWLKANIEKNSPAEDAK